MHIPAVRCTQCGFAWNSTAMAEGLRLLGACPKCGGELAFRTDDGAAGAGAGTGGTAGGGRGETPPHLVLGLPRVSGL